MVLQGDLTRKFRTLGPFELLFPINHFRNGNRTPAMSRMDVKVFSNINPATCNNKGGRVKMTKGWYILVQSSKIRKIRLLKQCYTELDSVGGNQRVESFTQCILPATKIKIVNST